MMNKELETLKTFLMKCIEDTPEDKEVNERRIYEDILMLIEAIENGAINDGEDS